MVKAEGNKFPPFLGLHKSCHLWHLQAMCSGRDQKEKEMSKVGLRQQEVRYLVSTDTVTVWRQFCLSTFSEAAHIRVGLSTKCYPTLHSISWDYFIGSSVSLPETQERKFGKGIKNNFSKSHSTVPHLFVFNSLLHTVSDCCALSALWLRHQPKPWASVTSEEREVPLQ